MCVQALLVLGGFGQRGGEAVSLMTVKQVNLFITLWLTVQGGAGIMGSHRVPLWSGKNGAGGMHSRTDGFLT